MCLSRQKSTGRMILTNQDIRLLEETVGKIIDITLIIDDLLDARIDEDLRTHGTRECGRIDRGPVDADSEIGRLSDRILLRMDSPAELMPSARRYAHLLPYATQLLTVTGPFGRSVVPSGKDPLILHDDSSDLPPETCGPRRDQLCHLHEILVIAGSFHAIDIVHFILKKRT